MKKTTFQYASNLWRSSQKLIPSSPLLILAGGTGSLENKEVKNFYNWASDNWEVVYTLLDRNEHKTFILPNNVLPLNNTYQVLDCGNKIGHCTFVPLDISVNPGHTVSMFAEVNVMRYGCFKRQKNGRSVIANDAHSYLYNPAKVYEMQ